MKKPDDILATIDPVPVREPRWQTDQPQAFLMKLGNTWQLLLGEMIQELRVLVQEMKGIVEQGAATRDP